MTRNIIILGAGFGGLRCALNVARMMPEDYKVILIDRNPYHLYYPKLFEMIMPYRGASKCTVDIKDILKGTGVEFVQGEVVKLDCKARMVEVAPSPPPKSSPIKGEEGRGNSLPLMGGVRGGWNINYDYLVLALGAGTDYFGIPGLQEYACTLKSLEDAERIRERVEEFLKDPLLISPLVRGRKKEFSIMIGGAGATGVEVAAALAHLFRRMPRDRWSITLVEALRSVLWMFPLEVSQYAHKRLEELGVKLMLDTCIKSVNKKEGRVEIILAPRPLKPGENESELACDFLPEHEKRVTADVLLWAGGVRANPLLTYCGLAVDRKGRLEVDEHLQVKGLERVFAIGDNATLLDQSTKQPVPATAQAALLQGKIVAGNIMAAINGIPLALYSFPKFPAIVPLADKDGVALTRGRVIRGLSAWILRQAADYRYFASIVGWFRAIRLCLFS